MSHPPHHTPFASVLYPLFSPSRILPCTDTIQRWILSVLNSSCTCIELASSCTPNPTLSIRPNQNSPRFIHAIQLSLRTPPISNIQYPISTRTNNKILFSVPSLSLVYTIISLTPQAKL